MCRLHTSDVSCVGTLVESRLDSHYYSQAQQGRLNKLCKGGWPNRPYANALTMEFTVRAVQH